MNAPESAPPSPTIPSSSSASRTLLSDPWRNHLALHARTVSRGRWKAYPYLRLVARRLTQLLLRGEGGRLIVEIPPQHGKSELISHRFPTYVLDIFPWLDVMLTSYGADLANGFSRQVRNTIQGSPDLLDVRLARDSTAADDWRTTAGGGMRSMGVGGGMTGKGANVLLIDDPVKNFRDALSQAFRDSQWDWWASTASTRLRRNAIVVLMMTRWNQDDLAGRLQADDREKWEVIRIPALAEDNDPLGRPVGAPLNPDMKSLVEIEAARTRSPFWFEALYQQRPRAREGAMLQRTWFKFVKAIPNLAERVRYWDRAATVPKNGSDPDWTAGGLVARIGDDFFIADIRRFRGSPMDNEREIAMTACLDRADALRGSAADVRIRMEQEPGSAGVDVIAHYQGHVLLGYPFQGVRSTGDKVLRAEPFASAAQAGRVYLVEGPWNQAFLDEIEMFPNGPHDDQVDAVDGAMLSLTGDGVPMFF